MTEYNRREQARIAKLQVEVESLRGRIEAATVVMTDAATEIKQVRAALRGLLDEIMCFVVYPPSAALNHAIEEASRVLEPKL